MYHRQSFPRLGDYIATVLQVTRLTKSIIRVSEALAVTLTILLKGKDMHFSVYYRLVDLLWDHLSDEELFRRLAREALERYIDYKKEEEMNGGKK